MKIKHAEGFQTELLPTIMDVDPQISQMGRKEYYRGKSITVSSGEIQYGKKDQNVSCLRADL